MMKMNLKDTIPHLINLLLAIIGFFLVSAYNRSNESLQQINRDILSMNKDLVNLKLEITELQGRMLNEARVKEMIETELLKQRTA